MKSMRQVVRLTEWVVRKHLLRQTLMRRQLGDFDLLLDLKTPGISRRLAVHGSREEDKTLLVRQNVKPGMICLDVGSNIGYYAVLQAKLAGPKGKVYCFEPDPRNAAVLKRNVTINGVAAHVEVFDCAVSDVPGSAKMVVTNASNLNTLVADGRNDKAIGTLVVPTITIDDFMAERQQVVNFIRMDIEGFEVEALRGMRRTLATSPIPCKILMELHPEAYGGDRDFASIIDELYSYGFYPKVLISAGKPRPEAFASRGLNPDRIISADGFERGYYTDIPERVALEICQVVPKAARYVLLEKR